MARPMVPSRSLETHDRLERTLVAQALAWSLDESHPLDEVVHRLRATAGGRSLALSRALAILAGHSVDTRSRVALRAMAALRRASAAAATLDVAGSGA
jgi:hypothetical protein